MRSALRLVGGILAVLALGAVLWVLASRWRTGLMPSDVVAIEQCRAAYGRATTARDSAAVDQQRPIISRGQASAAASCGGYRSAGKL